MYQSLTKGKERNLIRINCQLHEKENDIKVVKGFLIFLISLSVLAGAVPKEQIKNVNTYIQMLLGTYDDDFSVKIKSANRNDKTDLLDQIAVEADFGKWGIVGLGLDLDGKTVELKAKYSVVDLTGEFTDPKEVAEITEELMNYVRKYNEKGIYKASVALESDDKLTKAKITILPASEEAVSIKKIVITAKIPHEVGAKVVLKFKSEFNADAGLVGNAQEGLTGIFTSLSNKEEPKESDFDKLEAVFEAIMSSVY